MAIESLRDVLHEQVRDLLNAEKQLVKALPKMAKAASSDELREAIEDHLEETKGQVERLDKIFELMGEKVQGKTCKAMEGLIEEGTEIIEEASEGMAPAVDAALIAAAQRVEHYEISAYGSARAFAEELGLSKIAQLLQETLDEESAANETLTKIAEGVNSAAAAGADDSDESKIPVGRKASKAALTGGRGSNGTRSKSKERMRARS